MKRIPALALTFAFLALAGYLLGFAPQVINPGGGSSLATPVSVANGGTGIASGTSGGVPYYSGATTIASSGALTANLPVIGGGAGAAPTVGTVTGNTTQFPTWTGATTASRCVHTDASGNLIIAAADCGSGGTSVFTYISVLSGGLGGTSNFPIYGNCNQTGGCNNVNLFVAGAAGTVSTMYITLGAALAGTDSLAVTVFKNNSAQTVTCTVAASTQTCNDTAHSFAFVATDTLGLQTVCTGAGGCALALVGISVVKVTGAS